MIFILLVLTVTQIMVSPLYRRGVTRAMSEYIAHKLGLQHKLQKDPVPTSAVAADAADVSAKSTVAEPSSSPVPAFVPAVSPGPL